MDPTTRSTLIIILIIILLLFIAFNGSRYLLRRALKQVVKAFRKHQALSPETARTRQELGLEIPSFFRFKAFRDYKPTAFQVLLRNGIVQMTEDGKFFLAEDILAKTNIESPIAGQ